MSVPMFENPNASHRACRRSFLAVACAIALMITTPFTSHAQILGEWGEVDAFPQLWFNRVDGLHAGAELWVPLVAATEVTVDAGYKTALGEGSYGVRLENKWFETTVGGTYRRDIDLQYRSQVFTRGINGVYTFIGGSDYYDYFRREGGSLYIQPFDMNPTIEPRLTWRYERHSSVPLQTSYDLFARKIQPANPPVERGRLSSLEARVLWEPFRDRDRHLNVRRAELRVEHGGDWLGGDFDFTGITASVDARLDFTTERRAPYLRGRLEGSTGLNDLPYQRFGIVESVPKPLSIFGGMHTGPTRPNRGQHVGSAFWELNMRGAPFNAIGLGFLGARWDLYVRGGHGWADISEDRHQQLLDQQISPRLTDGGVHELGIGIGRILRVIRIDGTWRLTEPDFRLRFTLTNPF